MGECRVPGIIENRGFDRGQSAEMVGCHFFFEMIILQANVTVCVITDRYTVTIIHFYSTVAQVLRYDMCNRLRFLQILKITFFT